MESKRILVVDDEQPIRYVVEQAAETMGWESESAADAAGALQLVKEKLFDAAVIDFALPDMDGVRLHSEIRRLDPELAARALFISGVDQSHLQLDYYADAGGFLSKPFDIQELISRLQELLEA